MLPLTSHTPKPLLRVGDRTLIEHQIERLRSAGFTDLVINVAYLAEQIQNALGDGGAMGVNITYSPEPEPLETGGGINRALPLLGSEPFVLVNSDVWSDYPLAQLRDRLMPTVGAHLILVNNPAHHGEGDFTLSPEGKVGMQGQQTFTYSGISLIHPGLIADYPGRRSHFPLVEVFAGAAQRGVLTGELHTGKWVDVGTPERLEAVRRGI